MASHSGSGSGGAESDDQVASASTAAASARAAPASADSMASLEAYRRVAHMDVHVVDPVKVGSGMSSYTAYTVRCRTSMPGFSKEEYSVARRYSDFAWLREALCDEHKGCIVPPLPEKNATSRFDEDFVGQRRLELERFLQRVCSHPILHRAESLVLFLTSIDKLPWEKKSWGSGVLSKMGKIVGSVAGSSAAVPASAEPEPWFAEKANEIATWGKQLVELTRCVEQLVKLRMTMANSQAEFAAGSAAVAEAEANDSLGAAFAKIGEVSTRSKDLYEAQARAGISSFADDLSEYERFLSAVKGALADRARAHAHMVACEADAAKKDDAAQKLAGNAAKAAKANTALAEARELAQAAKADFEAVTERVRAELMRFEGEKVLDLQASLMRLVDSFIANEDALIEAWETVTPVVNAIVE